MLKSRMFFIGSVFVLAGCNSGTDKQVFQPQPIPKVTREAIDQNLKNGVIPTPQQVKENKVEVVPDACTRFIQKLPDDWFREKIEVPENPHEPNGRKINVFYYGKINEGTVPTIFFNGGPGASSHSSYSNFRYRRKDFDPNEKLSFVYIDQRDNGCSDSYPAGDDDETLKRLAHYGSDGIVADSEVVRKKLIQDKKWNVFGQSYGAHIVHRYVMQAPDSINVAFAHANILQQSGYERHKKRIASQIRVLKKYLEIYTEDKEKLIKLRTHLNAEKCYKDPYDAKKENEACGHELLETFNGMLGFTDEWLNLHKWIGIMVRDSGVSDEEVGRYLAAFYFEETKRPRTRASSVIAWVDRNVVGGTPYYCHKARTDLIAEGIDFDNEALATECSGTLQLYPAPDGEEKSDLRKRIELLPRNLMTLDGLVKVLTEKTDLVLNLYSGDRDTFVPVENFQEELAHVKELPNVKYTHFNGTGHDGFYSEPKVWEDLLKASILIK